MRGSGSERVAGASKRKRIGAASGMLSVAVSVGAIATAILIADRFSWASHALSDLGRAGWASATVFNGGLIVAGLLALPFSQAMRGASHTPSARRSSCSRRSVSR